MLNIEVEVFANLGPQYSQRAHDLQDQINTKAAYDTYAWSLRYTPRVTGALAGNVEVTPGKGGKSAMVYWAQYYAAYVENGTVRMAPRNFAKTAVQHVLPQWQAATEDIWRGHYL
jgi:hypothetical protein